MKFCSIILAIVFCLITVEGRNIQEQDTNTDLNENVDIKHIRNKLERRLRNRRQSFYNHHDYLNEFQNIGVGDFLKDILFSVREIEMYMKQGAVNRYYPSYYDNRPSYSNKCEDTLKELLSLYKDLTLQLKYSRPPPPQIIYVPYPVPGIFKQPVDKTPSNVNITHKKQTPPQDKTPSNVNITHTKQTPPQDKTPSNVNIAHEIQTPPQNANPIWMDFPTNTAIEDDSDGARPVSFRPKQLSSGSKITPFSFEHGSTQAGVITNNNPIKKTNLNRFGKTLHRPRGYK